MRSTSVKRKLIEERIASFEDRLLRAHQYLESGQHAHWHGFRPLFASKRQNGQEMPPHRDWVKNVFIPQLKRALQRSVRQLERLEQRGGLSAS